MKRVRYILEIVNKLGNVREEDTGCSLKEARRRADLLLAIGQARDVQIIPIDPNV